MKLFLKLNWDTLAGTEEWVVSESVVVGSVCFECVLGEYVFRVVRELKGMVSK